MGLSQLLPRCYFTPPYPAAASQMLLHPIMLPRHYFTPSCFTQHAANPPKDLSTPSCHKCMKPTSPATPPSTHVNTPLLLLATALLRASVLYIDTTYISSITLVQCVDSTLASMVLFRTSSPFINAVLNDSTWGSLSPMKQQQHLGHVSQ
jgi:hypothetical protein